MSAIRAGGDDIGAPRDLELEGLVRQTGVLAIVAELERRAPRLLIGRRQRANLQRGAIDDELEPVIVALLLFRIETKSPRVRGSVEIAHGEVADQVALA